MGLPSCPTTHLVVELGARFWTRWRFRKTAGGLWASEAAGVKPGEVGMVVVDGGAVIVVPVINVIVVGINIVVVPEQIVNLSITPALRSV